MLQTLFRNVHYTKSLAIWFVINGTFNKNLYYIAISFPSPPSYECNQKWRRFRPSNFSFDVNVLQLTECRKQDLSDIQGSAKRRSPGLVNFVPALAYHFCLGLPAVFTQPGDHILAVVL